MTVDVCVIGAGLSGLTVAHRLAARGASVRVVERATVPGGVIGSHREGSLLWETGPNSATGGSPALVGLIDELGLSEDRVSADPRAARRFILRDGRLVAIPSSPPAALKTRLVSPRGKLRLLAEPFIRRAPDTVNESVGAFVRRRLGSEVADYGMNPFIAGVFAGDPDLLEMKSAFPRMHALESASGSLIRGQIAMARRRKASGAPRPAPAGMFSFRNGMQSLTDALAGTVDITTGVTVTAVEADEDDYRITGHGPDGDFVLTAAAVVVATDADAARRLTHSVAPEVDTPLREIPYAPVAIVVTEHARADVEHPLDGFGFLIPARERRQILGTIFSSSLFPGRSANNRVLLTTFVGGMRQPALVERSDDQLTALVATELRNLLGARAPESARITRHARAIPQYTLGHAARISRLEAAETRHPGLFFCANYRGGISVGDVVTNGEAAATAVGDHLGVPAT